MAEDLWRRAEEDSLRGLFLRELRQRRKQAETEAERAEIDLAARFGLARWTTGIWGERRSG